MQRLEYCRKKHLRLGTLGLPMKRLNFFRIKLYRALGILRTEHLASS